MHTQIQMMGPCTVPNLWAGVVMTRSKPGAEIGEGSRFASACLRPIETRMVIGSFFWCRIGLQHIY